MQIQTQFYNQEEQIHYLAQQFPLAAERDGHSSPIHGGREEALHRIQEIRPLAYAKTRNQLNGAITHLSPYLHHGVITLAEVRSAVLAHTSSQQAQKLLQELAWRDYFQRVYRVLGSAVWQDIEEYKTDIRQYDRNLPQDIEQAQTGLACIDAFVHELRTTGYLHNHARMWTAAYVVHHRRIRWQAGAYWFLQHLLDGDEASNNLSWQWVASTFAAKPYFFNRENLARYTDNIYCARCPLNHRGCPFQGSYEELEQRLFKTPPNEPEQQKSHLSDQLRQPQTLPTTPAPAAQQTAQPTLVWVHEESLNPTSTALLAHSQATPIFVFDTQMIEKAAWTLKRLLFIHECLQTIPGVQVYQGNPLRILQEQIRQRAEQTNGPVLLAAMSPTEPRLRTVLHGLRQINAVMVYDEEAYVAAPAGQHIRDLRRFSHYWQQVQSTVLAENSPG
jgi:deoxyribodipyrimidine photo-lyase